MKGCSSETSGKVLAAESIEASETRDVAVPCERRSSALSLIEVVCPSPPRKMIRSEPFGTYCGPRGPCHRSSGMDRRGCVTSTEALKVARRGGGTQRARETWAMHAVSRNPNLVSAAPRAIRSQEETAECSSGTRLAHL